MDWTLTEYFKRIKACTKCGHGASSHKATLTGEGGKCFDEHGGRCSREDIYWCACPSYTYKGIPWTLESSSIYHKMN